jgi:hypothetical protein
MRIEKLEELTNEYLQKMKARVKSKAHDTMENDFLNEYRPMVQEFINIEPSVLEKYRDYFETYPMNREIESSIEDIVNRVYENITIVRRGLEHDEDIKKMREVSRNNLDEKEENYPRKVRINDKLQEVFENVEAQMRKREFNINWDSLKVYCKRIAENHTESIEQNVFEKNEDNIILEEVNRYIEEIEQENSLEKDNTKLEFKDGPVCPVVTDTNEFAEVNKQIADKVQEENLKEEKTLDKGLSLPSDIIF